MDSIVIMNVAKQWKFKKLMNDPSMDGATASLKSADVTFEEIGFIADIAGMLEAEATKKKDKKEQAVLVGDKLMCPQCLGTHSIAVPEIQPIYNPVTIDENGRWDWADCYPYPTQGDGSTEADPDALAPWYCRDCMAYFEAPNVMNLNDEPEEETPCADSSKK